MPRKEGNPRLETAPDPTQQVAIVGTFDETIENLRNVVDEAVYELKRSRTVQELILGQEVDINEDSLIGIKF